MKQILKRRMAGLLAAVCVLTAAAVPVSKYAALPSISLTASAETYESLTYVAYSDHVAITDCDMSATAVIIPAEINGLPVRVIGDRAFYACTALTSVTIPDSVMIIGNSAFSDCQNLTALTLPASVTAIGETAFRNCTALTDLQLPESMVSIGTAAFDGCTGLTAMQIPASVTQIAENPFSGCSSLQSISVAEGNTTYCAVDGVLMNAAQTVLIRYPIAKTGTSYTIPETVVEIAPYALEACDQLTAIAIPASVKTVGAWAFGGCTGLTEMILPDGITTIGDHAFCGCTALASILLPAQLTELGAGAFWGCTSLNNVVLPNKLTSLPFGLFYQCTSLTELTVPASVKTIKNEVFTYGSGMVNVYGFAGSYAETYFNNLISSSIAQGQTPAYTFTIVENPSGGFLLGDANEDSVISVEDAVIILTVYAQQSAGLTVELSDALRSAMDVDANGSIAVEDAVAILTYYAQQSAGLNPEW